MGNVSGIFPKNTWQFTDHIELESVENPVQRGKSEVSADYKDTVDPILEMSQDCSGQE